MDQNELDKLEQDIKNSLVLARCLLQTAKSRILTTEESDTGCQDIDDAVLILKAGLAKIRQNFRKNNG